jgi:hypothetical protein
MLAQSRGFVLSLNSFRVAIAPPTKPNSNSLEAQRRLCETPCRKPSPRRVRSEELKAIDTPLASAL